MKTRTLKVLFPLLFMVLGMTFLFLGQRRFYSSAERDNAIFRSDLAEASVPRAQIAALMSAQNRAQTNASSYIKLSTFIVLIIPIFMAIPLYSMSGGKGSTLDFLPNTRRQV